MKLSGLSDDSLRKDTAAAMTDARNKKLSDLRAEYADRLLAGAWYSLALGSEPLLTGDRRYDDLKAVFSSEDRVIGGPFSMIRLTDGRVELLGENRVKLTVSESYLAFIREYEIDTLADFSWMRNAFAADYIARVLQEDGLGGWQALVYRNLEQYLSKLDELEKVPQNREAGKEALRILCAVSL